MEPPVTGGWVVYDNSSCSGGNVTLPYAADLVVESGNVLTLSSAFVFLNADLTGEGELIGDDATIEYGTQPASLEYDANGNLQQGAGYHYEYNDANQLESVNQSGSTVAEYFYDHAGRRFKRIEYPSGGGNITTYYLGKEFETKVYSNGTEENTTYYYANGELVARKDQDGSKYYYHNDHLGGTHVVTNESYAIVERTRYYPFGRILREGNSRNLFTGQEWDNSIGMYYLVARYYNPIMRRFSQPDTTIPDVFNPQDLNRYSYVRNNPIIYLDSTGHSLSYFGLLFNIGGPKLDGGLGGFTLSGGLAAASKELFNPLSNSQSSLKSALSSTVSFYSKTGEGASTPTLSASFEAGWAPFMESTENFKGGTFDIGGDIGLGPSIGVGVSIPKNEDGSLNLINFAVEVTISPFSDINLPFPASLYVFNSETEIYDIIDMPSLIQYMADFMDKEIDPNPLPDGSKGS